MMTRVLFRKCVLFNLYVYKTDVEIIHAEKCSCYVNFVIHLYILSIFTFFTPGSRPSLKVKGKSFANGDHLRKFPFTKFTITYNGFVDWAGDFMLAVCRKNHCLFENNDNRSISYRSIDNMDSLEFVEKGMYKGIMIDYYYVIWRILKITQA